MVASMQALIQLVVSTDMLREIMNHRIVTARQKVEATLRMAQQERELKARQAAQEREARARAIANVCTLFLVSSAADKCMKCVFFM